MAPDSAAPDLRALRIDLFGGLQLFRGTTAVKFAAPAKAVALLAYLILHRSRNTPRDATAFALWPDDEETKARANLRRHIALLQATLAGADEPAILVDQRSIKWNTAFDTSVDVCEFERLSAREDGAQAAVALYKGDLLPDVYEEWLLTERERLHTLQSSNLERLSGAFRRDGDYSNAILTAKALLEHDRWREDTVRRLMSLRYESGDRAGALQEYERFARRLHGDLQVAPMPETTACYESIVRQAHVTRDVPALPPRGPAADNLPFVGRVSELASLHECWLRAVRGQGRLVFVTGEAGIGKSRLAAEFGSSVESQGGRVVTGATIFAEASPYEAIVRTLRGALPMVVALDLKPMWLAAAAAVLPELRQSYGNLPRLSALEPEREQARLFEALWRCFEGLARIRPLLVVLEDLHWAGQGTIDFLSYMVARLGTAPIAMLATYRDNETQPSHPLRIMRRLHQRENRIVGVPLGGLSLSDVERCIARIPDVAGASGFSQRVHALCAGNPFFLGEIVRESIASDAAQPALPQSLHVAIGGRIARLSAEARSVLAVAATMGQTFTSEIVGAAGGFAEHEIAPCMDELLDARFAKVSTGSAGDAAFNFAFSHQLVQAYVYATIATDTRRTLHRRIALVMEQMHEGRSEGMVRELARHFDAGGEASRAAHYYHASGLGALAVHADEEALSALSRAAQLTTDPELRYAAVALRETVYARQGMRVKQLADIEQLERLPDAGTHRLEDLRRRILFARAVDDVAAGERWIEDLQKRVAGSTDGYWSAFAKESAAVLMGTLGRYDDALREAQTALRIYETIDDSAGRVRSLCFVADTYGLQALQGPSKTAIDAGLTLAEASSNGALMIATLDAASRSAYRNNDYDTCAAFTEKGLALCQAVGDREAEADAYFRLGNICGRRFAIDAAAEHYAQATALYEAVDKPLGCGMVLVNAGVLYLKIGEHAAALRSFTRSRAIFRQRRDLRGLTICTINVGMAAYLLQRFEAARRVSRTAVRLAEELGTPVLLCAALSNLGAAERELGDLPSAIEHCERSMRLRREKASTDIASDLADLGLTYLSCGDMPAALRIAAEIVALDDGALQAVMYPQDVVWSAARIFAAGGLDEPYRKALLRAFALRAERIEAFAPGPRRDTYGRLRCNREIGAALLESDAARTAGRQNGSREQERGANQTSLRR